MNSLSDLVYEVLCQLGFSVDEETKTVINQDNDMPVLYDNMILRYSFDGPINIRDEKSIWFDIINNSNLMERLSKYYLKNQIEQEGIETLKNTEFVDNFGKHGMRTVKMINGEKQEFVTSTYHNRALMFIEQILDYNSMYNLNQYDWV